MHSITRLSGDDFPGRVDDLADVLAEVVAEGASVGFLSPFERSAAAAWWHARHRAVADGSLAVWVCRGPEGVVGTVGLALERKPNGRHRGEVVKLLVRPGARGRGLGRALLGTAEQAATRAGVTLLMLDTVTGSPAERLYHSAGWTRFGVVPDYASDPAGLLEDCSFFYKRLV
ncbi:GNAT family N-acetyltransferase [Streptomyces sp. B6B3]|uniref:GNAT family N-acetyltransferase n=1 Tax=Streptomyces sp. B6B3 TaxID=3153570 RepID=UPI00325F482A